MNRYIYDASGLPVAKDERLDNPFQYEGEYGVMDDGTGLEFMRARDYCPEEGRFLQGDPSGIVDNTTLYVYADNNYTQSLDPTGLSRTDQAPRRYTSDLTMKELALTFGVMFAFAGAVGVAAYAGPITAATIASITPMLQTLGYYNTYYQNEYPSAYNFAKVGINTIIKDSVEYQNPKLPSNNEAAGIKLWKWLLLNWPDHDSLSKLTYLVRPHDPNDKLSPAGYGNSQFTKPGLLDYTVRFENEPDATAPAREITVTDVLNPNLDLNTFALTEITFANQIITVPDGLDRYQAMVPMSVQGHDIVTEVQAGLDRSTRTLTLTLRAYDPTTGWFSEDPLVGLLYPDDDTLRGQGSISYRVAPRANLPTGTVIDNRARIVFDYNDPIDTPQVFNTLDTAPPTSQVVPLPATTTDTTLTLTWSGQDDPGGSDIASYTVFVSVDGTEAFPLIKNTTDTSAAVNVQPGHTYAFYTLARDKVGHIENPPATPDATTTTLVTTTINAGPDQAAKEGDTVGLSGASYTSSVDASHLSLTIRWGDGSSDAGSLVPGSNGGTIANTHRYADNGVYIVTLTLRDSDGTSVQSTAHMTVANVAPTAALVVPASVTEGSPIVVALVNPNDPSTADVAAGFTYAFDRGDGSGLGPFTPQASISIPTTDNGSCTIRAMVRDKDAGVTSYTASVTITGAAPTATLASVGTVAEGSTGLVSFSGVFDPSPADTTVGFRYSFDFNNDGTFEIANSTLPTAAVPAAYLADGPSTRTILGRIADKDGGFTDHTTTIQELNVAPSVSIGADVNIGPGTAVTRAGSFADLGADTWAASVDYGDGSGVHPLPLNPDKSFALSHTYANPGSFAATVCVKDKDGAVGSGSFTVVVLPAPVVVQSVHWGTIQVKVGTGKKGKTKSQTALQIQFSGPVSGAGYFPAYQLSSITTRKVKKQTVTSYKPVRLTSAVPASSPLTSLVSLLPAKAPNVAQSFRTQISAAGITDSYGRAVDGNHDGQPGGDFVANLSKNKVTILAVPQARSVSARTAAVDVAIQSLSAAPHGLLPNRRARAPVSGTGRPGT